MGEKDKVGLGKVQFYKIIEEADVWWGLGGKNEALQRGEVYVEQKIRDGNRVTLKLCSLYGNITFFSIFFYI